MASMNAKSHFIFYVRDQAKSTEFYKAVLSIQPSLFVPGMTEFVLNENCVLGLMPEIGIKKLLGDAIVDPSTSKVPRAELYLLVENPEQYFARALTVGAKELSPMVQRDWGDFAGYIQDLDGHVVAFATTSR